MDAHQNNPQNSDDNVKQFYEQKDIFYSITLDCAIFLSKEIETASDNSLSWIEQGLRILFC